MRDASESHGDGGVTAWNETDAHRIGFEQPLPFRPFEHRTRQLCPESWQVVPTPEVHLKMPSSFGSPFSKMSLKRGVVAEPLESRSVEVFAPPGFKTGRGENVVVASQRTVRARRPTPLGYAVSHHFAEDVANANGSEFSKDASFCRIPTGTRPSSNLPL